MKARTYTCCICGKECQGYGNNPSGAMCKDAEGNVIELSFKPGEECCDDCNRRFVVKGRLYKMTHGGK